MFAAESDDVEADAPWPAGCLGYAVNLVRPKVKGHRSRVLRHLLGSLMVFVTEDEAYDYRKRVTQVSRATPCADAVMQPADLSAKLSLSLTTYVLASTRVCTCI